MAMIEAHNLSFAYATDDATSSVTVFGPLSFNVEEGSFSLLTGLTGCGKTTLLRMMKPELAPVGSCRGSLEVCGVKLVEGGRPTGAMDNVFSAENVGFVMQDPDAQIVCDTVWHEMAFGLENIGADADIMRRRVAEVAHFLGIASWVDRRTDQLSGGQKQLLNLAAILVLRPRLLLLDEPCAQLDPTSRRTFLNVLASVQRELGLTVVMATHMPEEAAAFATQDLRLSAIGDPAPFADALRVCAAASAASGEAHASAVLKEENASAADSPAGNAHKTVIRARDVFVRHSPEDPWVLKGLDLRVMQGTVHAVVGGNGSGKTTLLRTLAGNLKPRRGKVENACANAQAFLPQDPKAVFVADTVAEELCEWQDRAGYSESDVAHALERFGLAGLEERHPYDLSGGQRQNLAFAKMVLCRPRLMLLDEPTKGLDAHACAAVVRQLRALAREGVTIVLSTHDLDVAAVCADEATLIFDGQAVCTQAVPAFFEDNLIWRPHASARLYGALL